MHNQVNPLLSKRIYEIRQTYLSESKNHHQPKIWSSVSENEKHFSITIVIPTKGCSWALSEKGGCSVCGYVNDSSRENTIPINMISEELKKLIIKSSYNKPLELQIFNSGSFFDPEDVPNVLRNEIVELIQESGHIFKLSVECRPEYILKEKTLIEEFLKVIPEVDLEIGLGLESSNNAILQDCWNKGTTLENYKSSVEYLHSVGISVKSYVFIKPPFLNEQEALRDTIKTISEAIEIGTDVISINPCNIQNGTLVYDLYKNDKYQPPWLWTVLSIIRITNDLFPNSKVICDPTAAGKDRGAHNCGKCDKIVLKLIQKAVKKEILPDNLSKICSCYDIWRILVNSPWEYFRINHVSQLRRLKIL